MSQPEINCTVVSTRDSAGLELPAVLPRDNLTSKTQSPVSASKLSTMFCKSVSSFRLALTNSVRTSAMVLIVADGAARQVARRAGLVLIYAQRFSRRPAEIVLRHWRATVTFLVLVSQVFTKTNTLHGAWCGKVELYLSFIIQ